MAAVDLEGAYNVRDLGCLQSTNAGMTRPRMVYRSDSLDYISKRDEHTLFSRLKIRTVIDLRMPAVRPGVWSERPVTYYRFPLIDQHRLGKEPFPSDHPDELAKVYLGNVRDGYKAVADVFRTIHACISCNTACLFNCAAGRDRTGVISALLLSLVGVPDHDVAADYVASNRHADDVTHRLEQNPLYANGRQMSHHPRSLRRETILMFLELICEEYDGPSEFLQECGILPNIDNGPPTVLHCLIKHARSL